MAISSGSMRRVSDDIVLGMERLDQGGAIPKEDFREFCRAEAARLRELADTAETIEKRIALLEGAELYERLARGEPVALSN